MQSTGKLNSSSKSLDHKKKFQSPYKPYLDTLKNTPKIMNHSSHSQLLSNYYKKNMIPPNLNSPKIKKVLQPFVKSKQN